MITECDCVNELTSCLKLLEAAGINSDRMEMSVMQFFKGINKSVLFGRKARGTNCGRGCVSGKLT